MITLNNLVSHVQFIGTLQLIVVLNVNLTTQLSQHCFPYFHRYYLFVYETCSKHIAFSRLSSVFVMLSHYAACLLRHTHYIQGLGDKTG